MIHEAKIVFHNLDYFNFDRKPDANHYEAEKQYDLFVMIDRQNLSILIDHGNPLCKIQTKILDFNAKNIDKQKFTEKEMTIFYIPPAKKSGQPFHINLATIKSSKPAISQIREAIGNNRKYKSCLSFAPSRVKHISILSGESPTQKFRGFLNLVGVMFLILNLRNIIQNFIRYGIQFGETPTEFIPISFVISMAVYLIFPLLSFLVEKSKFKKLIPPFLAKMLYIIGLLTLLAYNIVYCQKYKPSPLLGIIHTASAVIILLKLISYYQVGNELYAIISRMEGRGTKKSQKEIEHEMFAHYQISEENLQQITKFKGRSDEIINLKELFYFIFIPTLCFQLTYPKTSQIRKGWLIKRIIQVILISGFQMILLLQYIEPELNGLLETLHKQDSTWYEIFNRHLRLSIPNTIVWIAGFYVFFHLCLNIMGEILYFGDRNFYQDWWNCRSLEEYWKTWNLPVHFWFIRHVYNPLLQIWPSKIAANLVVFLISAIAHEYVVSVPLGFISYWAFLAMLMQAPIIIAQKKLGKWLRIENSELGNASFWLFFCIIGQPLVVFIYYSMYTEYRSNPESGRISGYIPIEIQL